MPYSDAMSQPAAFERLHEDGRSHLRGTRYDEAAACFTEAAQIAATEEERALAEIDAASVAVLRGSPSIPVERLSAIAIRHYSPRHSFEASYYLVMHFCDQHQPDRAMRYVRGMLAAAEEVGAPASIASAHESAAGVAFAQRNFREANRHSLAALQALGSEAREEYVLLRASILHNIGYTLLGQNEYQEASEYLVASIELLRGGAYGDYLTEPYLNLAFACCALDRVQEAAIYASAAEAQLSPRQESLRRYIHYIRGEIAQSEGRVDEARAHFDRLSELYPDVAHLSDLLLAVRFLPILMPE